MEPTFSPDCLSKCELDITERLRLASRDQAANSDLLSIARGEILNLRTKLHRAREDASIIGGKVHTLEQAEKELRNEAENLQRQIICLKEQVRVTAVPVQTVIHNVLEERRRQDQKWGQQDHDPLFYGAILAEEFGEAMKEAVEIRAASRNNDIPEYDVRKANLRKELVQTAAVAVAFVECLDRGRWSWGS